MSELLAVAATAGGLVMAAAPALQIRRMLTTRSSEDFSIAYMSVLLAGFGLWLAYGASIGNSALIVSNTAALSFGLVTVAVAVRLRMQQRTADVGGR